MKHPLNHLKNIKYLIFFSFLFPTFDSFDGLFGFSAGTVLFRLLIIFLLSLFFIKNLTKIVLINSLHKNFLKIIFIYFLIFLFLVSWSLVSDFNNLVMRDIFELHRPFYYGLIVIVSMILWNNDHLFHKYIISTLTFITFIEITLAFLHPIRIPLIQEILMFYTKTPNALGYRSTGTFGNPYDFGVIMIFFTFLLLQRFKFEKKYFFAILLTLSFFGILLSQSKTALFIFIFCSIYSFSLSIFINNNIKSLSKYFFALVSVMFLGIFFYQEIYIFYTEKFIYMDKAFDLNRVIRKSFQEGNRLYDLFWVLERYSNANLLDWLFGLGIGKGIYDDIEFGYAIYLYRYGIVGLILYLSLLISTFRISLKAYLRSKNKNMKNYEKLFFSFHIWSCGLIFGTLANNFIDQPRITFLYFTILGLCLGFLVSSNNEQNKNLDYV